jgi:large subunit ribosomal protein L13
LASQIATQFIVEKEKEGVFSKPRTFYIDASGLIAGRVCSNVAKLLLQGNSVMIVNAEQCLFSGSRKMVMTEWLGRLKLGSVVHPKHGPFHPRTPPGMLTRMVRGMLPRRKPSGAKALKRLRVYSRKPQDFSNVRFEQLEDCRATKPIAYYVSLGDVAERIGWKGRRKSVVAPAKDKTGKEKR